MLGKAAVVLCLAISLAFASAASARPLGAETRSTSKAADPVAQFHQSRLKEPLWFKSSSGHAAQNLLSLLGTAEIDGISKEKFELGSILIAVRKASGGDPAAVREADLMLSRAFVAYAQQLQQDPKVGIIYVDPALKPAPSPAADLLADAAKAPSLEAYIGGLGWMNPLYGQLRQALVRRSYSKPQERHVLLLNLQRARGLPPASRKYILVNTANQRLYMYQDGKVVDQMKIIAGRANAQTPLMNAYIRFAVVNPYWNVPTDLSARLAPKVVKDGPSYLRQQGYQVVSDFGANPRILDPSTIDWNAVSKGEVRIQMRQLPGPANSMGRIKFMFPNSQGVWLHDTPVTELFERYVRLESAGCVRLEDAWRLGSWLFQRTLRPITNEIEQQLELPEPVPVYITYLTAIPAQRSVSYVDDVYGRDPPPIAEVQFTNKGLSHSPAQSLASFRASKRR